MQVGIAQCVNKGMQRDYSMDKASQEFAYENRNIRITTNGDNSFLSVTNEKSTEEAYFYKNVFYYKVSNGTLTFIPKVKWDNTEHLVRCTIHYTDSSNYSIGLTSDNLVYDIGNKEIDFIEVFDSGYYVFPEGQNLDEKFSIKGTVVGEAVIGNIIVLFTVYGTTNYIYKLTDKGGYFDLFRLYEGKLSITTNNPLECISSYEGDEVQKVYWVDGVNQPRYINVFPNEQYPENTSFDFVPSIVEGMDVTIEKEYNGTGNFKSGIIQYYITYYKKFGAETNAVYQSPLYYISPENRGGEVGETQTCSFKLTITPKTDKYDYVKVYSLIKTSFNSTQVSVVSEAGINKKEDGTFATIQIIDTNINNIPVAPTDILFLGGNTIIANTIEQKNNTLFLGNITELKHSFDIEGIKANIKSLKTDTSRNFTSKEEEKHLPENILKFKWKVFGCKEEDLNSQYSYFNQLNENSATIKGFKHREVYRFGFQLQTKTGEWSQTIWLDDLVCDKYPKILDEINEYNSDEYLLLTDVDEKYSTYICLPYIWFDPTNILNGIDLKECISYRMVRAESSLYNRSVVCQGYVVPTLYNSRLGNVTSWTVKPVNEDNKHWENTLYLGENTEGSLVPTPKTELDLSLYTLDDPSTPTDEGNLKLKGYNVSPEDYSDGWNITSIKIGYSCRADSAGLIPDPYVTISLIFKLYNYNLGYKEVAIYKTDFDYLWYSRKTALKETRAWLLSKTYNDIIDTSRSKSCYDIICEEVKTSELQNVKRDDPILNAADEFPWTDTTQVDYVKIDNTVSRKYDPYYINRETQKRQNHYFINASTCNLFIPNFDEVSNIINNSDLKFRIVGKTDLTNNVSSFKLQSDNTVSEANEDFKLNFEFSGNLNNEQKTFGLHSYPLWSSFSRNSDDNSSRYNWTYLWNTEDLSKSGDELSKISNKVFANLFYSSTTEYNVEDSAILWKPKNNPKNIKSISDDLTYFEGSIYSKKVEDTMFPKNQNIYYTDMPYESNFQPYYYKDTKIEEVKYNFESVKINYDSTNHVLIDLDTYNNRIVTLPGYENYLNTELYNGNTYDVIGNTTLPLGERDYTNRIFQDAYPEEDNYFSKNFQSEINYPSYYTYKGTLELKNNDFVIYFYKEQQQYDSEGNLIGDFHFGGAYFLPNFKIGIFKESWGEFFPKNTIKFFKPRTLVPSEASLPGALVVDEFKNIVLPVIRDEDIVFNFKHSDIVSETPLFEIYGKYQLVLEDTLYSDNGKEVSITKAKCIDYNPFDYNPLNVKTNNSIWIAELYKDFNDYEPFGGTSDNAIELNTFIPISYPTKLDIACNGLEGDTYFQRWDSLRTYPVSNSKQSLVDAVSLMVETYTNLDGRSDATRGRKDVENIRPENIQNTINNVYTQDNNYITSSVLDEKLSDSTHPLLYTWSLSKQQLSDIDNWTAINLSSSLQLDGNRGVLNKLKNWNDKLIAFQDEGIALINYNEQTTISTNDGIPVEISNSGKVTGHYYLSTTQGCKNKWSIVDSPYGLYFIDSYNKSINVFNSEGIKSLSTINLFEDWIRDNEKGIIWKPTNNEGFKSFYDPIHKEVYFINNKEALCYNELLSQFTSFYDYERLNSLITIGEHIYGIRGKNIHKMFEGNTYCNLFGEQKEYYVTYKINKDPFIDKTWTNVEYRADVFDSNIIQDIPNLSNNSQIVSNTTFDKLEVWNEYQYGSSNMSKAKPKFRIWRADIPRDTKEGRGLNRIRNPWIMIKLSKENNTDKRMEFHDLLIKYLQ